MILSEFKILRDIFWMLKRIHVHPAYFIAPLSLAVLAASLEGVSLGLLVPMLNGFLQKDYSFIKEIPVLSTLTAMLPLSITNSDRALFGFLISMFVAIILLKNIFRYLALISMSYLSNRGVHHLRKHVFEEYLSFGKLYFDKSSVGHHATLLSEFTKNALGPLLMLDKLTSGIASLAVYTIVMCFISWQLTLVAIPLFLLLHVVVRTLIVRIQRMSHTLAAKANELGKRAVEILSIIPLVKSYNMENEERKHYTVISDQAATLEFRKTVVKELVRPLQETIALFAMIILFSFMLYLLTQNRGLESSALIVYFYIIMNATTKFSGLTSFRGDLASAAGPVREVMRIFEQEGKHVVPSGKKEFPGLKKSIEFRDVHFQYAEGRPVLTGMNLTIDAGAMTAVVGPTGAGKTTITSLLLRYYDCPPHAIFLDGTDIRDFSTPSLLKHIAVVSQDTLLLHDSLRANITYGLTNIADAAVHQVIEQARLADYVSRLPNGLDTLIGDRGVQLSGGEKQRVSIARALLRNADILILDEATSSLDSRTEKLIQEAIQEMIVGRTAIVIAHRLSTIKNADKIAVIEGGKCVEEGKLDDLLHAKSRFHTYWEEQKFS